MEQTHVCKIGYFIGDVPSVTLSIRDRDFPLRPARELKIQTIINA